MTRFDDPPAKLYAIKRTRTPTKDSLHMRLVLASQSPYRKQQLESLGLNFIALSPKVDEDSLKDPSLPPEALALHLAKAKAQSLSEEFPQDWILGADQLVNFKGEVLGKAGDFEKAQAQLLKLQGNSHELITSFYLCKGQEFFQHTDKTLLTMRTLNISEIRAYLEKDKAFDCAGSYKLEKAGIALFEKIETKDASAIQGLPLIALSSCWRQASGTLPFVKEN